MFVAQIFFYFELAAFFMKQNSSGQNLWYMYTSLVLFIISIYVGDFEHHRLHFHKIHLISRHGST